MRFDLILESGFQEREMKRQQTALLKEQVNNILFSSLSHFIVNKFCSWVDSLNIAELCLQLKLELQQSIFVQDMFGWNGNHLLFRNFVC